MSTLSQTIRGTKILDLGPLIAPELPPNATAQQALLHLVRGRRGALVVVEDGHAVGIFTERDVLRNMKDDQFATAEARRSLLLRQIMSSPALTVRRQATLDVAIDIMAKRKHRHLVVVDREGRVAGLLTANDLTQFLSDQYPKETVNLPPRLHQVYRSAEGG